MVSLEDFKKIKKDSSKDYIINQAYWDYVETQKIKEELKDITNSLIDMCFDNENDIEVWQEIFCRILLKYEYIDFDNKNNLYLKKENK